MTSLLDCLKVLPTDYEEFGGEIKRWKDPKLNYPDCSGCKFFVPLDSHGIDLGVCSKKTSPRAGMLTWRRMSGFGCYEAGS
jgi:hypothetical protein